MTGTERIRRSSRLGVALVALGLVGSGCLPGDERPEPGSLFVTAGPNQATANGFATPDGWDVTFDRFVTAVGHVRLSKSSCNPYGEPHYTWLFDFTEAEREKVALIYALGDCGLEFDFRPPDYDSPLGAGATAADKTFMRVPASDAFGTDQRIAVIARGSAERGGVTKRFDWHFRHRYEIKECPSASGDGFVSDVTLEGGDELTLHIIVRAEELFRQAAIDEAPLHFDRFAEADADGDGAITLDELIEVDAPLDNGLGGTGGADAGAPDGGSAAATLSLAELVYLHLLGRIMLLEGGGTCAAEHEDH